MRIFPFVIVSTLMLMSVVAHAGDWPPGKKSQFMDGCLTENKSDTLKPSETAAYCKCRAEVLVSKFTTEEIDKIASRSAHGDLENRFRTATIKACSD